MEEWIPVRHSMIGRIKPQLSLKRDTHTQVWQGYAIVSKHRATEWLLTKWVMTNDAQL